MMLSNSYECVLPLNELSVIITEMMKLPRLEEGWSTALFLLGALLAAGWTLVVTGWTEGLDVVPIVGVGGLAAGLFLGWSIFRGWMCHIASGIYGLAWVGFLLGRGLPGELAWDERITQLAGRLSHWAHQAVTGGTGHDSLIFVMLLSGLFWILGYNAGWNTYRRMRVWRAILPMGTVALLNVYYYGGSAHQMHYLMFHLLFTLLYIARSHVFEQEEVWQRERMAYDPDLRSSFLQSGLVLALIALALAWTLPGAEAWPGLAVTWRRISTPWRIVKEEWQRLFSDLYGSPVRGTVEPFGTLLVLGGPREERDVVLLDIAAPREGRYYWRSTVYAHYGGNRWKTLEKGRVMLVPGQQPPEMAQDALRHPVVQTMISYMPGCRMLVGASQLIAVDREAEACVNLTGDAPLEFLRILSALPLEVDDQYLVLSQVSDADATSLREAGTDYPDWVRQRYLQLPASLPDRVRLLAEEITVVAENPYDKAVALEQYLRRNITYELTPPDPPEGRDYVDFLLFNSRRDYCSGYATAMAVLARSVSIPARLVAGYAEGEYDAERGVFRVREKNAHSWVEIYFPGYGWIEFEPTTSERPLIRPERTEEQEAEDDVPGGGGGEGFSEEERMRRYHPEMDEPLGWNTEPLTASRGPLVWPWAVGLAFITLSVGGWWATENWGFRGLSAIERAYARLLRFGHWLGRPLRTSNTPFEWARDVSTVVPDAQEPVGRIVELYVCACFARGDPAAPEVKAAWKQARPVLWRAWLKHIVSLPRFLVAMGHDAGTIPSRYLPEK
jgi:hypothetical protein